MAVNSKFEIVAKSILQLNIGGIEEMLDMPVMGEVQMNLPLANIDCVGQDDLYKNESHGKSDHGIFCVTGKYSGYIDIEDLY